MNTSRRNSSFCNSPTRRALTSTIPRARFATTRFVILNPLAVTLRNRAVAALASARNSLAVFRVLFGARSAALAHWVLGCVALALAVAALWRVCGSTISRRLARLLAGVGRRGAAAGRPTRATVERLRKAKGEGKAKAL